MRGGKNDLDGLVDGFGLGAEMHLAGVRGAGAEEERCIMPDEAAAVRVEDGEVNALSERTRLRPIGDHRAGDVVDGAGVAAQEACAIPPQHGGEGWGDAGKDIAAHDGQADTAAHGIVKGVAALACLHDAHVGRWCDASPGGAVPFPDIVNAVAEGAEEHGHTTPGIKGEALLVTDIGRGAAAIRQRGALRPLRAVPGPELLGGGVVIRRRGREAVSTDHQDLATRAVEAHRGLVAGWR